MYAKGLRCVRGESTSSTAMASKGQGPGDLPIHRHVVDVTNWTMKRQNSFCRQNSFLAIQGKLYLHCGCTALQPSRTYAISHGLYSYQQYIQGTRFKRSNLSSLRFPRFSEIPLDSFDIRADNVVVVVDGLMGRHHLGSRSRYTGWSLLLRLPSIVHGLHYQPHISHHFRRRRP